MIKLLKRRINWPAVCGGVVVFCIQLTFLPETVAFVRASKVVPAKVVALNAGGRHPQVEFTTLNGQHISVPASSWFHDVEVDETVEMRYDPIQPRVAYMNTLFGVWFLHLFSAIPAIALVVGGLLGLSGSRSGPK